ncbi:hypothetical protein D210916BOD24_10870 [Alteromonas sp. D210916BOD_24]|uniref:hypothetical protein n=1 Tax=Alteromonas sp. D210916BOD_24 TaxID=3157618 RepID=UPI00399CF3F1
MLYEFIRSLSRAELQDFADKANVPMSVLRYQYGAKNPAKRNIPNAERIVSLANASEGLLDDQMLVDYFLTEKVAAIRATQQA